MKNVSWFLKKGNAAIPFLGVYPKEMKASIQTDTYLYINIHNSIIHRNQKTKTSKTPIEGSVG
jgi:hypothetical protein